MSLEDYMNVENLDGRQLEFMMMSGIRSQDRQMIALDAVARHEASPSSRPIAIATFLCSRTK